MKPEMVGPPAPHDRLPAEPPQSAMPEKDSLAKMLLPLVLAQGADLASTEVMLRRGGLETNPLPGMQSTGGRLGWGALETALLALIAKKGMPVLRDKVVPAIHGTLAGQNMTIDRNPSSEDDRIGVFTRGRR